MNSETHAILYLGNEADERREDRVKLWWETVVFI